MEIVCNECGAVVRTVSAAEIDAAMREMGQTDAICSTRCTHGGVPNTFPGLKSVDAII